MDQRCLPDDTYQFNIFVIKMSNIISRRRAEDPLIECINPRWLPDSFLEMRCEGYKMGMRMGIAGNNKHFFLFIMCQPPSNWPKVPDLFGYETYRIWKWQQNISSRCLMWRWGPGPRVPPGCTFSRRPRASRLQQFRFTMFTHPLATGLSYTMTSEAGLRGARASCGFWLTVCSQQRITCSLSKGDGLLFSSIRTLTTVTLQ